MDRGPTVFIILEIRGGIFFTVIVSVQAEKNRGLSGSNSLHRVYSVEEGWGIGLFRQI